VTRAVVATEADIDPSRVIDGWLERNRSVLR
jgi:hypothetical protein